MENTVEVGIGGYCFDCDPSHPHPLNNVIVNTVEVSQ